MRKVYYEGKSLGRILGKRKKNIAKIEKALKCKIVLEKNKDITIKAPSGKAVEEYLTEEILEALALGFNVETALLLQDTDYVLKVIDLKNYAHGSRLNTVISRIIGKKGKAKRVIQELSHCHIIISGHKVGIIGKIESVELASQAIEKLIRGAPHSNVFKFLERSQEYLKEQERLTEELKSY
ncbi:MAG: KH domain-containing protein [Candidatus Pacearchaeota archaeon]